MNHKPPENSRIGRLRGLCSSAPVEPSRTDQLKGLLQRMVPGIAVSPSLLDRMDEALTHVSTGQARNHERLEFLGDAVLRLAATQFIDRHHPDLSVGECSALRAQLVSDRWLAKLGLQLDLDPLIQLGDKARGDLAAKETLRADATEALIGALYACCGDLVMVDLWLTPHWQRTSAEVLADPHRGNNKSALQEWSQGHRLGLPTYSCTETNGRHGDRRRFHCRVSLPPNLEAEGWGGSRRDAEQQAAGQLLAQLPSS